MPLPADSPAASPALRRHDLVWIVPAQHAALSAQIADAALSAAVLQRLAAGAPLVVGRQTLPLPGVGAGDGAATLAAGMPLPPAAGKHRLPFRIEPAAIARASPPWALAAVIPALAARWRGPLQSLHDGAAEAGIAFRVFGSAAWEALTGEAYMTPQSDIDLLWRPRGGAQLDAGLALLHAWERATGLRADGEILFGADDAVAWREWDPAAGRPPSPRVLVKTTAGPYLCRRERLLAVLDQSAPRAHARSGAAGAPLIDAAAGDRAAALPVESCP